MSVRGFITPVNRNGINRVKDISLPNSISSGVYIVQLQTEAGKLSTKIIIE